MKLIHFEGARLQAVCAHDHMSLRQAMIVMNEARLRLIPVVREGSAELVGVLADGDIRRFLAGGGKSDARVIDAINATPRVSRQPVAVKEARAELLRRGVEYLPVVKDGQITDLFVLWAINMPTETTAVIMAGGLGTRLSPLTDKCPKPLVELGGRPILSHIIEHLQSQGVSRFVLAVNYLAQMIVNRYGDGSDLGIEIEYVHETKRLGTGGALSLVAPELLSEPFLCMNGDILTDVDVGALTDAHRENDWSATMVTREHQYTVPYGVIRRSAEGRFQGSDEKPTVSFPINAGIYMLSKDVLPLIPQDEFFDLPTLFDRVQEKTMSAGTFGHDGRWIDIGSVAELERARLIFESEH